MSSHIMTGCLVFLIITIFEIHDHNKKLYKYFPEDINTDNHIKRNDLHVYSFPLYVIAAIFAYYIIKELF